MSDDNDLESEVTDVSQVDIDKTDPQTLAYQISAHVMEEFRPGFVVVGSPIMGTTALGYPYPDAVGLIINETVGLTKTSLAAILEEIARQLMQDINDVENYLREES
jgi:hypothetical protein